LKKNKYLIEENKSIRDCLESININQNGIVFIVNSQNQVIGVATDGDIREHLLSGSQLEDSISGIFNKEFIWAGLNTSREEILKRLDKDIRAIPILNENKELVDIATRDEIPLSYEKDIFIRSKSPVRVTFGGGGSDLSHFFSEYSGAVINATISLYSHATLKIRPDKKIKISSLDLNDQVEVENLDDLFKVSDNFNLFKSLLKTIKPEVGFELYVHSDFPPGSGLGGSSVVSAAVLGCFNELRKDKWDAHELSELAFQAERLYMDIAGGWQDQYATVFGGFNFMEFKENQNIIHPLRISQQTILELEESLLLYKVGEEGRSSGKIHKDQKKSMQSASVKKKVNEAVKICFETRDHLLRGRLIEFGRSLDKAWQLKRQFSTKISNAYIDEIYEFAMKSGAIGGKLLGAGGGGYFLFFVDSFNKHSFIKEMKTKNLYHTPFQFDHKGTQSWTVRDKT